MIIFPNVLLLIRKLAGTRKAMTRNLLIAGLLAATAPGVAQNEPDIGICTNCSTAEFAYTAEQAAPPTAGNHPVYVIDAVNGEVRYFDVEVWWDCGGYHLQSMDSREAEVAASSDLLAQSNCAQKEAVQGNGNAAIILDMQEAHYAVKDFVSPENLTVYSGEIPNSGDSAIDLVGPNDSSAGYNRGNLALGLTSYYGGLWGQSVFMMSDLARRFSNRFIGSSDYLNPASRITVIYPDGTRIKVKVTNVSSGPDGSVDVEVHVLPESAQLPDGRMVPQMEGHFDGFDYSGDTNIVDAIRDLANLYGIPVTGAGGGGGGGRIACVRVDGGDLVCRILPE